MASSSTTTALDLFGSPSSPDVHDPFDDLLSSPAAPVTTSHERQVDVEEDETTASSNETRDQPEEDIALPVQEEEEESVEEPVEEIGPVEEEEKVETLGAQEKEEEEVEEHEEEAPGDLNPALESLAAPTTLISDEPSPATSFHPEPSSFSPPPTVESTSSSTIEQPTAAIEALFSTEEEGDGPEEWLQDEEVTTVPSSDDLAPTAVVPSSSPPLSPPPPAVSTLATDELFASDDGLIEVDDWLAEESVPAPKEEQPEVELHPTSLSPHLQALPIESTLPQPTSPTVLSASPIFAPPSNLDPTLPFPSAPTMSDLFFTSEDTSDDWLANHIDPESSTIELEAPILDFGATVEHVEFAVPTEAADTNELFGSVEEEGEDLFGGLGERAAVVEETSFAVQEMASNPDLSFDPSPPATTGLSFDDSEDPFLAPSQDQDQLQPEEVAAVTDETDYSTQGYYDESGEWIWFDIVEPSSVDAAPVEGEEIAVSSPSAGATWPSVPGASLLTRQGSDDKLLRSPAVEQGAFEFGLSESEARRTPLSSPFLPSETFPIPEPEDITPFVSLQPAPLGRSASSNPYASGSSTKTANPYATANPYTAAAPRSANPYSTPIPASANPYGSSSTSSPYGLAPASSPNPYASPVSPNPYFNAPSVYSPPIATPPKPAPPPFQRQTTQTYNAYDPPEMPIIPVRRAKAVAPPGGAWGAQPAQVPAPYNAGFPPVTATPPKPAGPPPPPPKRVDSWSQRPVPPPAAVAPPSRPTSAFDPPPQAFTSPLREQHQPPLPKVFSPPPPKVFSPHPPKTFSPPPPQTAKPPPPRPPPAGRAPSFNAPPPQPVAAFHPTMPSALGMSASSLLVSDAYGEEDGGETPTMGRSDGRIVGQMNERTFLEEEGNDGGEGGGGQWNDDERDEDMELLENSRQSIEVPVGRSSSEIPNGRTSMDAPRWGQPPPPRTTTPSYARSVASPPPGPPPRPSSTVSNASSRYGAPQHAPPPPLPPVQPPSLDQGYQPCASNGSAPYARSMVGSPPPRPPSASQGRANVRHQPPPLVSNNSTFAPPPPPPHTPPPPRPASTSNAYASYGMTSSQSSPQRIPGYSPVQPTTSLPPHAPSHSNYNHPRNTSAPYDASQTTNTRAPYAAAMVAASVSSTSLHSQAGGALPSAYAPDVIHSLAEDPLGRASEKFKKVPVMSFGFGGKVAVCYPSLGGGGYGGGFVGGGEDSDGRDGRSVRIKALDEIVPETALKSSTAPFPGPVFLDPAPPRGAAGDKIKRAAVLGYLDARAVEIEQGLGWLKGKGDDAKFRSEEGKAVLMRLVGVMVANEGRLMGSAKVEDEVRAVLLPHLRALTGPSASPLLTPGLPIPLTMTSPSSNHNSIYSTSPPVQLGGGLASQRNSLDFNPSSHGAPSSSSSSSNRPANLDHLQGLLFRGEKKQAVQFARDEKMWSHALIISSCIDKQTWGEVVKAFARSELPCSEEGGPKGRDALRLTYEMFGGAGTATLTRALPTVGSAQPPSSLVSVEPPPTASSNSPETLSNWREIVAMLVSNRSLGDTEALNDLGDSLVAQGWTAAGHCCYILSAPTPPLDGLGSPVPPRVHLYGSSFSGHGSFDIDGVLITEIIEYALSLIPVLKGQEAYSGIAYLQSYKLLHAFQLAEVGDNATAQRYCEAIASSLKTCRINSPHHTLPFLQQLKELSERLSGTAQMDKSGTSWISRNVSKPSLDSFGTWFEGRLTKFVAGDGLESPTPDVSSTPGKDSLAPAPIGPFSHFDAISPAPTSTSFLNRAASSANLSGGFPSSNGSDQSFPKRSGSAMALRPGPFGMQPLDRSSSALDFTRNSNAPPVHQPLYSADHAQDSFDRSNAPYPPYRHSTESSSSSISTYGEQIHSNHSPPAAPSEEPYEWGSSSAYDQPTEHNTPKANTFESGQQWGSSSYGIDTSGGQNSYSSDATETAEEETNGGGWGSREEEDGGADEDDDDLGLGNSKGKKPKARGAGEGEGSKKDPEETPKGKEKEKEEEKAKEVKPAASTGWLGRLWGSKKEETPAAGAHGGKPPPIKAKLGEKSAFYYDTDLKKWVNNNAPEDAAASKPPPPPPSRSQTVSPSRAHRPPSSLSAGPSTARLDGSFPSGGPPPPSSARLDGSFAPHSRVSSAPSTRPPTGPPSRVNSTTGTAAPPPASGAPPPGGKPGDPPRSVSVPPFRGPVVDQTAELMARTPTPGAGGSAAARKKNLRSRYVDVFEQT